MSFSDVIKNIVTGGKHGEVKKAAHDYEQSVSQLNTLISEHNILIKNIDNKKSTLQIKRENALKIYVECFRDLDEQMDSLKISTPELTPYIDLSINRLLDGLSDKQLIEAMKKSNVGSGVNTFLQYYNHQTIQNNIKSLQNPHSLYKPQKHDNTMLYGAAIAVIIDAINTVISGIGEAKKALEIISEKQVLINKRLLEYKTENTRIRVLIKQIDEDIILLHENSTLLPKLRDTYLEFYEKIVSKPSIYKLIVRFFKNNGDVDNFTKKEREQLQSCIISFKNCANIIHDLITKSYELRLK